MTDGAARRPQRLDGNTVRNFTRQISMCTDRKRLDDLTRQIWRTYNGPEEVLEQLQVRIEAQRAIIARNNPR